MLNTLYELFADLWYDESGTTFIEYAMIATAVGMALVGSLDSIGSRLDGIVNTVGNTLQ